MDVHVPIPLTIGVHVCATPHLAGPCVPELEECQSGDDLSPHNVEFTLVSTFSQRQHGTAQEVHCFQHVAAASNSPHSGSGGWSLAGPPPTPAQPVADGARGAGRFGHAMPGRGALAAAAEEARGGHLQIPPNAHAEGLPALPQPSIHHAAHSGHACCDGVASSSASPNGKRPKSPHSTGGGSRARLGLFTGTKSYHHSCSYHVSTPTLQCFICASCVHINFASCAHPLHFIHESCVLIHFASSMHQVSLPCNSLLLIAIFFALFFERIFPRSHDIRCHSVRLNYCEVGT
jgi:hypothetical protein